MKIAENSQNFIQRMKIFDLKKRQYVPFILWPKQIEYVKTLHAEHRVILLKKRQVAGTTLTVAEFLVRAMCLEKYLALILSKTGEDAIECIRRAKDLYNSLPDTVKQACPYTKPDQPMDRLEFMNGSRLLSLPANKGAGYTADAVFIDEAAHITTKNSHISLEEVFLNVVSTLEHSNGQLVVGGTARGLGKFHEYFRAAKAGRSGFYPFFFSCWDDPNFTPEKRDALSLAHGEAFVNENYPRNDTEAFVASGHCRFNIPSLTEIMDTTSEGTLGYLDRIGRVVVFRPNPNGWVRIWEHTKKNKSYLGGFDTSEGIQVETGKHTDPSAGVVFDKQMNQVAEIRAWLEPDVFAEEIMRLADYYNGMFIGVERNKDGLGVLKILKNNGHHVYRQESFNPDKQLREPILGWRTDKVTKPAMEAKTDQMLREGTLKIKSPYLCSEMMTFVRQPDGNTEAQEGCYDDLNMGCMIACMILPFCPDKPTTVQSKWRGIDYYSGTTYEKRIEGELSRRLNIKKAALS